MSVKLSLIDTLIDLWSKGENDRAERLAAAYERLRKSAMIMRYQTKAVQDALAVIERIEKEK